MPEMHSIKAQGGGGVPQQSLTSLRPPPVAAECIYLRSCLAGAGYLIRGRYIEQTIPHERAGTPCLSYSIELYWTVESTVFYCAAANKENVAACVLIDSGK